MRDWQKDLEIYKIKPAPPKMELQEYIERYYAEKNDKYISWFLHYYEKSINTKVMGWVQNYAMYGHFPDIKQAYVIGILNALKNYDASRGIPFIKYKENTAKREVHEYIRTMRTGFTIQSNDEYLRLRKAMRLYYEYQEKTDAETMQMIADEIGTTKEMAEDIIRCGLQNTQFVEFYRQYEDEENEKSREEVAFDNSSRPDDLCIKFELANLVMDAFEHLTDYREKAIVAAHLGFCIDCYSAEEPDYNDLDYKGNPILKPRKGKPFVDIAVDHMLSSPATADKIYRKALEKMRRELMESGYFCENKT